MNCICKMRKSRGYMQGELAKSCGMKQNTLSQYESGKRNPSIPILKKISEVLNCTVDDLIKEDKEEE